MRWCWLDEGLLTTCLSRRALEELPYVHYPALLVSRAVVLGAAHAGGEGRRPGTPTDAGALERVLVVLYPDATAELRGVVARMLTLFADGLLRRGSGPIATETRREARPRHEAA